MKRFLPFLALFLCLSQYASSQNIPPVIKWQKSLGGSASDEYAFVLSSGIGIYPKISLNDADGYVVAGESASNDKDVNGNHGSQDIWIAKVGLDGNVKWSISLGGTRQEVFSAIKKDIDGGYIVTGMSRSNDGDVHPKSFRQEMAWLIKLDRDGHMTWNKVFDDNSVSYFGDVQVVGNDGYVLIGFANSLHLNGESTSDDMWVVRTDRAGNVLWQKGYGGSLSDADAGNIQITSDSGFIVAGMTYSSNMDVAGFHGGSELDIWVVKLDRAGLIQWTKCLGGSGSEIASNIRQTADGGYIIAGRTNSSDGDITSRHGDYDAWVIKLSASGSIQWQKTYGGSASDGFSDISELPDGSFIASGFTSSTSGDVAANHGSMDYWLVKFQADGQLLWEETYGGAGNDICVTFDATADGDILMIGESNSSDQLVTGNNGNYDLWLVRLSQSIALPLSFIDVSAIPLTDARVKIQWTAKHESALLRYEVQKSFDGKTFSTFQIIMAKNASEIQYSAIDSSSSEQKVYYRIAAIDVARKSFLSQIVVNIPVKTNESWLTIFPNPVGTTVTFRCEGTMNGKVQISIQDISGKKMMTLSRTINSGSGNSVSVPVDQLKSGLFVLVIECNGIRVSKPFLKL